MTAQVKIDDTIQQSVNNFVKDLQSRIMIFTNSDSVYLNPKEYELVQKIIFSHTRRDAEFLNDADIALLLYDEIEVILNIVCDDKEALPRLLNAYNSNVYTYNANTNPDMLNRSLAYFEKINKMIQTYILEYKTRNSQENEYNNAKVAKLQHYIDIFSNPELDKYMTLEEYNELFKDLNNYGLLENDFINILKYIHLININLSKHSEIDSNLTSRVSHVHDKYLADNKDLVKAATTIISEGFDIDILPTIASDYAKANDVPAYLINNTIVALIITSYYNKYIQMINDHEDVKLIKGIKDKINSFFTSIINVDELVMEATEIVNLNRDTIERYTEDAYDYINMTSEQVEEETGDMFIKTVPLLLKMKETILHINELTEDTEEYKKVRKMLEEILTEYKNMVERLDAKKLAKE